MVQGKVLSSSFFLSLSFRSYFFLFQRVSSFSKSRVLSFIVDLSFYLKMEILWRYPWHPSHDKAFRMRLKPRLKSLYIKLRCNFVANLLGEKKKKRGKRKKRKKGKYFQKASNLFRAILPSSRLVASRREVWADAYPI